MTAMGRLFIPGNEVMLAFAAVYHGNFNVCDFPELRQFFSVSKGELFGATIILI
jgi:hypothetical protein